MPDTGILKPALSSDAIAGFVVFLLALPLSLGIAKASDFPPMMGVFTAITGGMLVSFFAGSQLSIKGPAAGLIVIVLGAVNDFGGGEHGWRLALGTIFAAGLVQVIFGFLRLGRLVDFFPLSSIHGMLAAIGMIIIIKQLPILLNVDPGMDGKGKINSRASVKHSRSDCRNGSESGFCWRNLPCHHAELEWINSKNHFQENSCTSSGSAACRSIADFS